MVGEEQLIQGLKNRDEESFIAFVDIFKNKINSLCYSYTQDYHEAEDLSQEIFITLYNNIVNFRGECSLSTYIYRIAVSRCIDFKRRKSIKSFLTGLLHLERENEENLDDRNYIRDIIRGLQEDQKTSIVLFYYIGLTQKEIADVLNTSVKTIEGRIYRAKQKIKSEMEKEGYRACSRNGMI